MSRALRRSVPLCLVLLIAALLGPQLGQAAGRIHLSVHRSRLHINATITGAYSASKCVLDVSAGGQHASFTDWNVRHHSRVRFTWAVSANAPSGVWHFAARCGKGRFRASAARRARLRYHGSDHGAIVAANNSEAANASGGGKGGGNQSCQTIEYGGTGQECFINDPFATYRDPYVGADIGQCTWYAAGMRPDLDGITTGNAGNWLTEAAGKKPEGTTPEVGAIAVNKTADGGVGHVAYVAGVENGGQTLVLDEANLHNRGGVFLNVATPASDFQGYIYGGAAAAPVVTQPAPSQPSGPSIPSGTTAETTGGVSNTWSNYQTANGTQGPSIPANTTVGITCRVQGFTVADGNNWWYEVGSSPWSNHYYVSADAFYNNGATSGSLSNTPFVDDKVALCPTSSGGGGTTTTTTTQTTPTQTPPPPPPTWNETVGGVAHTWTNYQDAGGTEGPSIAAYQTVAISCRLQGFTVADGNTWWYRIASSPWNNAYYVSADAFYNNGATSGSLIGTPFYDPAVALC